MNVENAVEEINQYMRHFESGKGTAIQVRTEDGDIFVSTASGYCITDKIKTVKTVAGSLVADKNGDIMRFTCRKDVDPKDMPMVVMQKDGTCCIEDRHIPSYIMKLLSRFSDVGTFESNVRKLYMAMCEQAEQYICSNDGYRRILRDAVVSIQLLSKAFGGEGITDIAGYIRKTEVFESNGFVMMVNSYSDKSLGLAERISVNPDKIISISLCRNYWGMLDSDISTLFEDICYEIERDKDAWIDKAYNDMIENEESDGSLKEKDNEEDSLW